jgi:ribosomal protein L37AE/L43A
MKPEDRRRLKRHIEMIVEHKMAANHTITFCPNCEKDTECEHVAELYECKLCGEEFEKYVAPRKPANSDVSVTENVLTDVKTGQSIENTNPDYYKDAETIIEHLKIRLSEWQGVARQLADELTEANSERFPISWEDASETSPAWIAYCNLRDMEE